MSAVPTRPIPFDVAPGEALFNPRGLKFRVCLSSPSESDGGNDEEEILLENKKVKLQERRQVVADNKRLKQLVEHQKVIENKTAFDGAVMSDSLKAELKALQDKVANKSAAKKLAKNQ